MRTVVVVFFLVAIVFYVIGYNVPAIGLLVLGFVFEMLAWSTWIGESFKSRKNEDSENK